LNLENKVCSEHVIPMVLHELLKLFPRRREPFESVGIHIEVPGIHSRQTIRCHLYRGFAR
jgi:microcompartment protein CcmL/EutN